MVSCGGALIKYLLFFFNLLWLALGGVILYFGFRITSFSGDFHGIVDLNMKTGAIVILAAGFLIFVIAFLGCCGAIKENSCMLSSYAGIILILVIVQCVGAYLAFKYRTDVKDEIVKGYRKALDNFKDDKEVRKAIDKFQNAFKCCGGNNYTDFNSKIADFKYPATCCDGKDWEHDDNASCTLAEVQNAKYPGCFNEVASIVEKALGGLGGVAIGLVLIQLLIIISACCLAREVR